jgi:hypothetical protein
VDDGFTLVGIESVEDQFRGGGHQGDYTR